MQQMSPAPLQFDRPFSSSELPVDTPDFQKCGFLDQPKTNDNAPQPLSQTASDQTLTNERTHDMRRS
jgi:hypothetical protein